MQELRVVAVSEDGSYAVLTAPGRSGRFVLPIDERLRAVAKGQFSRLAQYEIEVESPLRPKEIQDRIRAGETAEDIADAAGVPVERIRRFEGPVLAEREYRAQEAQRASVRGLGEAGPGPRLGDIVERRLAAAGAGSDDVEWDSRKRQDGTWQVQLVYTVAGRLHMAEWIFDPRGKHVTPDDDEAMRLCLPESDWLADRPAAKGRQSATVTPIGARAGSGGSHQSDRPDADRSRAVSAPHPARIPLGAAAAIAGPGTSIGPVRAGSGGALPDRYPARRAADPSLSREAELAAAGERAAERTAMSATPAAPAAVAAELAAPEAPPDREPDTPAPPAKRAPGGRSRRSSVPSWDEIMFGTSRQAD